MPLDDEFVALAARVRNWGRWGDDDELGTLNLIDAAAVKRGAACVQTGKAFSLAIPWSANGPHGLNPKRAYRFCAGAKSLVEPVSRLRRR